MKHLLTLCVLLCTLTAQAQDSPPKWKLLKPATPDGFEMKEVVVATYPEDVVKMTVYVPKQPGNYPCILDIHGGGWAKRQVESDKPMMERLAQRGYVTAIIAYRLSTTSKYPAALHDCKSAIRTLRANAKEWHIDPERIGCMGGSAGGHLSGLVSMTSGLKEFEGDGPHQDQSSAVKAAIVMAATQDMLAANKDKTSEAALAFFGVAAAENEALYRQASPFHHVRPGVPPTIYIEGEKDLLKVGGAEMMEKLKSLGIETAVHTLKHAPHPFWMSDPWCAETVEIADAFFKRHLAATAE